MCLEPTDLEPGFDSAALSPRRLLEMAAAGQVVLDCRRELRRLGRTIVEEAAGERIEPFTHYPQGDVYDYHTHSQFYFHIHRTGEHGHFHTFLRPKGMPPGVSPADPADRRAPGDNDALSHLVAIGVDGRGEPSRLFTTNRWVTAETWYKAADVRAMLPCFQVENDRPSPTLSRWVTAMVALFRPQIDRLLVERDAWIARNSHRLPGIPVFEDRDIEVTSQMAVNVEEQIAQVQYAVG
jgi:hypothetical protein